MINYSSLWRAVNDWEKIKSDLCPDDLEKFQELKIKLKKQMPEIGKTRRMAKKIVGTYPRSDGARVLRELLAKMSG